MRLMMCVLGSALIALALATPSAEQARPAVPPPAPAPAAAAQPPERSVIGTLDEVNVAGMQIVVGSAAGRRTFRLQSGVTIRQGSKTVKLSELLSHKGERVKVRYRESGGVQRAAWIVLASPPSRPSGHADKGAAPAPPAAVR